MTPSPAFTASVPAHETGEGRGRQQNGPDAGTSEPDHVADNADIEAICSSDIGVKAAETQAGNNAGSHFLRAVRSHHGEMDMHELLDRLGNATQQQLADDDWMMATKIGMADSFFSRTTPFGDECLWWFSGWHGWQTIEEAPEWLLSVDAALTLVACLHDWCLHTAADHRWLGDGSGYNVKLRTANGALASGHADTLPLAICIAALRAKSGEGA